MFCHRSFILLYIFLFSIRSKNVVNLLVIGEGVEGVSDANATIHWEDRHLKQDRRYNAKSTIITNDVVWNDHKGKPIKANRCGTISHKKINGEWYMVGSESHKQTDSWFDKGDVYLYKSATLGSNSWHKVKKVHDFSPGTNLTSSTCEIIQRFDDPNIIIIHCRFKVFISYTGIKGKYTMNVLDLPEPPPTDGSIIRFGGSSTYQEGKDLYMIASRARVALDGNHTRSMYIYKMNSNWTDFDRDSDPISWSWSSFEAPMVTKMGKWYYIFASKTRGWRDSRTYYRIARSLEGLADVKTSEVVMHPSNTEEIKSMGTQFCFFQRFGNGKWMFGGRRHPSEAPELFAKQYGKNVMVPARFIKNVPHVYWKYSFNWRKYDYKNPSSDKHTHFGYGHKSVPCVDSTDKFWVKYKGNKTWKIDCGVLDDPEGRTKRCNRHMELEMKCPVSCKTFGCK